MSSTAVVFLGLIAVATLVTAAVQVALVVALIQTGRRLQALADRVEQDLRPLIANATAASNHAVRVSELAVSQVERADRLFADLAMRVEQASRLVHSTLLTPAREGRALLAAISAVIGAVRDGAAARAASAAADEDDPLFIG